MKDLQIKNYSKREIHCDVKLTKSEQSKHGKSLEKLTINLKPKTSKFDWMLNDIKIENIISVVTATGLEPRTT